MVGLSRPPVPSFLAETSIILQRMDASAGFFFELLISLSQEKVSVPV